MKPKDTRSSLALAVESLEAELLNFDRLADQALRHPLNSEKHLQSTASSLQGIGALEPRLEACMRQLMDALNELGARQQGRMLAAQQRAQELAERHAAFMGLMGRLASMGSAAGELQANLEKAGDENSAAEPVEATLRDVVDRLARLVQETGGVEDAAKEQDFVDIARHASSLRQQLASAHAKMARRLAKVAPAPAGAVGDA